MKILVADDDPGSLQLLKRALVKWGYDVVPAADGTEAWGALQQENPPRLAILDWMMPAMDGVQVCREVRKRPEQPYTYLILLTAKTEKQDVTAGIEAGADDYLTKPFDANELRARIRAGRRILEFQDKLIAAQEALLIQATRDSLTGLWNRAAILDILRRELGRAKRGGISVGVVMADLDHFKRINDTYGHLAGDEVLREIARRMRSSVRLYDSVGRYGGEEFLIILPDCDASGAKTQTERLRAGVCGEPIVTSEGSISATISLGVCAHNQSKDAEFAIRAADAALYRAKNGGRNRVELATSAELAVDHLQAAKKANA